MGYNTLEQIERVKNISIFTVSNGFHNRNDKVANCDWVIAFGIGEQLRNGGTKYTYDRCKGGKIYVNILTL